LNDPIDRILPVGLTGSPLSTSFLPLSSFCSFTFFAASFANLSKQSGVANHLTALALSSFLQLLLFWPTLASFFALTPPSTAL
jgi:hypothetical protein